MRQIPEEQLQPHQVRYHLVSAKVGGAQGPQEEESSQGDEGQHIEEIQLPTGISQEKGE